MEQHAPHPNNQIADKAHEKHGVVSISNTASDSFPSQNHKHQIRDGVHDLGWIDCGVVVLHMMLAVMMKFDDEAWWARASSHQFIVDVTGPQYPVPAGG